MPSASIQDLCFYVSLGEKGLNSAIKVLTDRKTKGEENLIAIIKILIEEMDLIEVLENKKDNSAEKSGKLLYFSQRVSKAGLSEYFKKKGAYNEYYNHLITIFEQISEVPLAEELVNYYNELPKEQIYTDDNPPF